MVELDAERCLSGSFLQTPEPALGPETGHGRRETVPALARPQRFSVQPCGFPFLPSAVTLVSPPKPDGLDRGGGTINVELAGLLLLDVRRPAANPDPFPDFLVHIIFKFKTLDRERSPIFLARNLV
ncbi:MAG: hypothetical protein M3R62_04335 [Acidobacteriota bacterium]|nr:hypothetical protein [Acidobacteriota bacterium]